MEEEDPITTTMVPEKNPGEKPVEVKNEEEGEEEVVEVFDDEVEMRDGEEVEEVKKEEFTGEDGMEDEGDADERMKDEGEEEIGASGGKKYDFSGDEKDIKYCQNGIRLILEIKNSSNVAVPKYNAKLIKKIRDEQLFLMKKIRLWKERLDEMENDDELDEMAKYEPYFEVLVRSFERNKRIMIAYSFERIERTKSLYWENNGNINFMIDNLGENEKKMIKGYIDLIENFTVDLLESTTPVVTSLFVQVKVLKDYGELQTVDSKYVLRKGNVLNMKKVDAIPLEKQGIIEEV